MQMITPGGLTSPAAGRDALARTTISPAYQAPPRTQQATPGLLEDTMPALTPRASINPEGAGVQQLTPAAFLAWAGAHPAVKYSGQYAGPIYSVTFSNDVLVSANEIFEP